MDNDFDGYDGQEDFDDDAFKEEQDLDDRDFAHLDEDDELIDGVGFANPGGNSALRAATRTNPRIHPCPTCQRPNMLTPADVARSYQCDICADALEKGGY